MQFDEFKCLNLNIQDLSLFVAVIALPVGWLGYQIFDEMSKPHNRTKSFALIKKEYGGNLSDEECLNAIDFILYDDTYTKYIGWSNTIGGFWDHYYSRSIVGFGSISCFVIITAFLVFLSFVNTYIVWPLSPFRATVYILLSIFNLFLFLFMNSTRKRIYKEVDEKEILLVKRSITKLNDYKNIKNK